MTAQLLVSKHQCVWTLELTTWIWSENNSLQGKTLYLFFTNQKNNLSRSFRQLRTHFRTSEVLFIWNKEAICIKEPATHWLTIRLYSLGSRYIHAYPQRLYNNFILFPLVSFLKPQAKCSSYDHKQRGRSIMKRIYCIFKSVSDASTVEKLS